MPVGGATTKSVKKSKTTPKKKTATKSKTAAKSSDLSKKTVPQLRVIAKKSGARQTNKRVGDKPATTKNKAQLIASIRQARN